ncbi:MAG: hypothetical protein J4F31_03375 [Flavobacteriales bacterium]|nr:hypothetical protein [Flavobacteriales bacterium]
MKKFLLLTATAAVALSAQSQRYFTGGYQWATMTQSNNNVNRVVEATNLYFGTDEKQIGYLSDMSGIVWGFGATDEHWGIEMIFDYKKAGLGTLEGIDPWGQPFENSFRVKHNGFRYIVFYNIWRSELSRFSVGASMDLYNFKLYNWSTDQNKWRRANEGLHMNGATTFNAQVVLALGEAVGIRIMPYYQVPRNGSGGVEDLWTEGSGVTFITDLVAGELRDMKMWSNNYGIQAGIVIGMGD